MEHSTIADMAGWRSLAVQLALVAIGLLSVVILFSFGGQLIVAPALLPMQWLLARHTDGWVSKAFALLGALLFAESVIAATTAGAVGITTAIVFYTTSRRR